MECFYTNSTQFNSRVFGYLASKSAFLFLECPCHWQFGYMSAPDVLSLVFPECWALQKKLCSCFPFRLSMQTLFPKCHLFTKCVVNTRHYCIFQKVNWKHSGKSYFTDVLLPIVFSWVLAFRKEFFECFGMFPKCPWHSRNNQKILVVTLVAILVLLTIEIIYSFDASFVLLVWSLALALLLDSPFLPFANLLSLEILSHMVSIHMSFMTCAAT